MTRDDGAAPSYTRGCSIEDTASTQLVIFGISSRDLTSSVTIVRSKFCKPRSTGKGQDGTDMEASRSPATRSASGCASLCREGFDEKTKGMGSEDGESISTTGSHLHWVSRPCRCRTKELPRDESDSESERTWIAAFCGPGGVDGATEDAEETGWPSVEAESVRSLPKREGELAS